METLLQTIRSLASEFSERRHRLHLTLVSAMPSVPLEVLPAILDEIRVIIEGEKEEDYKRELVEALFTEIEERVGDREKEYVVRWWGHFREDLEIQEQYEGLQEQEHATARL
jgi:hypothetical protein